MSSPQEHDIKHTQVEKEQKKLGFRYFVIVSGFARVSKRVLPKFRSSCRGPATRLSSRRVHKEEILDGARKSYKSSYKASLFLGDVGERWSV